MSNPRNPQQHVPFREGRGYSYLMPTLVESELTKKHGEKPDRALVIQNMTDKSKLAKSWEPNSEMMQDESKKVPFIKISEEITESIGVLFNSGQEELVAKANEFTAALNKLSKDLASYNTSKGEAEKDYAQLKSELSGNSRENAAKREAYDNKYKELPAKLKDLEERFHTLRELVDTTRRPVMGLRPE